MTGSTISSISAAITSLPPNIEPPGPRPFRPGPRSPARPLGHRRSCDQPSCALSRPEPIKLTVPTGVLDQKLLRHNLSTNPVSGHKTQTILRKTNPLEKAVSQD